MIEVTERSMPATIRTKVCPMATARSGSMSARMLARLSGVAIAGTNSAMTAK
jgi:hypothetical protein